MGFLGKSPAKQKGPQRGSHVLYPLREEWLAYLLREVPIEGLCGEICAQKGPKIYSRCHTVHIQQSFGDTQVSFIRQVPDKGALRGSEMLPYVYSVTT